MDSKLPRSNRNGPRVADSNPDSIANKNLEKAEANITYQDSLISRMQRVAQDDPRTKDLTKPTATKDLQPKDFKPKDFEPKNFEPNDFKPKDSSEK